jgi:predicted ATPase/signal transduction histidine kinase/tRNA A-37 threonylcarbamoyl transferase component Bud32
MVNFSVNLPGYRIDEKMYVGIRTFVYRGIREIDNLPVILKLMRKNYPSFNEIVQFRNQYTICKNLGIAGVVEPLSLETYQNGYALVMEDFGGISLKEYTEQYTKSALPLNEFLTIAIQIASILDEVHCVQVIHKDIKPSNILIHPETKQIKLIDFSIASLLPKETQTLKSPNVLEGTLAYMSPEQTGRMNRGIDYRSDFYSFGVTLYELLTGQLPFISNDAMELVHCHIAKLHTPVNKINSRLPTVVTEIINKLMAKNAEDRYQSLSGLKYDLEQCLHQLENNDKIIDFPLATKDIFDRFIISEKLYGRETEVEILLAAFDRVVSGSIEIMLVAGFSGIGKTAVVNEVHKPIVYQRGYFIKGKYDQFQRNIPFSAFLEAFRDLMEQLLSESDAQLQKWKAKILTALGEQAQVIIEVIPELEKIIGQQPAIAELYGSAATNRFNLLLQKFMKVFADKEHPLVIFIDDLQWADTASLKLMKLLVGETDTQYLLLIGAYRDNEVSAAHPLMMTLDEITKEKVKVSTITLNPISLSDLNNLVADTLNCSLNTVTQIAELIYQKTQGNPFFCNQFLKYLYDEKIIIFAPPQSLIDQGQTEGSWQYELSRIKELVLSDDVVEFMTNQLQKLPLTTQAVLKLAACIGNQFNLEILSIVNNKSQAETAADLWKALQEGLIIPINEAYKFYQETNTQDESIITSHQLANYKFLHDRVQQAAYSLIPEEQKKSTHLSIGQLLLNNIPVAKVEERIFDIVNQLNYGVQLINNQEELLELARLNLIAGRKANISTAYTDAFNYFNLALEIVAVDSWQSNYPLCLALHEEACDAAFLCGDFEQMERQAETVINFGANFLDKVRVYEIKIQALIVQNKFTDGLNIALDVLNLINIEFPESPRDADIQQAFQTTAAKLTGKKIADLANLPEMSDPKILAAMGILSSMFSAAYLGSPKFVPLITLKMVDLSIEYGNTGLSANGYCTYGFLLCSVVGDIEVGYEFAQLSLDVLYKTKTTSLQAQTLLLYNSLVGHWKNHARNFLIPLQEVYQLGLETGDIEFASYALHNYSFGSYLTGKELIQLEREMAVFCETLNRLKQTTCLHYVQIWQQTVLNLTNQSEDLCRLIGTAYDEEQMLPLHLEMKDVTAICMLYFNKFTLNYLFGNTPQALEYLVEAEKYLDGLTGLIIFPAFYFYDSLLRLSIYYDAEALEKNQILEKVHSNQDKMQHWANHAAMNFLHKYYLVEAEKHRILDDKIAAMDFYDKAISLAKQNEYLQEEALANELAAKFYLEWDKQTIAQTYLINAYYCYARWGASAKADDLEKRYPELLFPIGQREKTSFRYTETISVKNSNESTVTHESTKNLETLDLLSFIKASQTISSEIEFDKLLISLMQILIENAGASKIALILPNFDKWVIQTIDTNTSTTAFQSTPVAESKDIPINLINYVSRTQEYIICNNCPQETQNPKSKIKSFKDSYIRETPPKSLLCTPIINQGKLIAILYLENNVATDTFNDDRLQVINLLCSQAAISLENAYLYQQAQKYAQQTQDYAQQLESSLENLKQAQLQLVQSEKMSTLGNLVSGIGHEINNPINFISGNLQPARDYIQDLLRLIDLYQNNYPNPVAEIVEEIEAIDFEYIREDLPQIISSMRKAIDRIYDISVSLRTFSRADTHKKIPFNIHDGIDSTLMILKHRLKASDINPDIEVVRNYGNIPPVNCFPGQLNQVFMNLIANAIDALEDSNQGRSFHEIQANPNRITITTSMNESKKLLSISVEDNGLGMTKEVKERIFDHLFTTKRVGKGTGLGLAIAYQIVVEKHGGAIEVDSQPGLGATFIISIPI